MSISVAIVEDNPDYRLGTSMMLTNSRKFQVVGKYEQAEPLIEKFAEVSPDVVLMDIGLPGISGIEAASRLKREFPYVQIIMLTVYDDDEKVFQAICAGASGYVSKNVTAEKLVEAVEDAFNGGTPISPHIASKVLQMFKEHLPMKNVSYSLTKRELKVLEHLVQGDDYKTIADKLFLSNYTVRAHTRNIYDKLHVHSKSQAVAKALKENLLPA
ncbi:MAG: response regulator transcription factor [Ignavibacteriales bacterium]|nr:response regulator transcription factor [Ignavibacteriales bacterium]